ncbi:DUF3883 domain-containing protein [Methylotenera sp. N17]|uniref:DUF3883 domain-containing protein n=1 Tax=Methylotenera sp. N17 TaxID=1502761 RepID=UPI000646DFC5|nr:DUF3883 domain-containing protein [Methylotenera sp. N17]
MIQFSPGLAQSSFELLDLISRSEMSFSHISVEFSKIGVMSAKSVLELSQSLNWVQAGENGEAVITVEGARINELEGYENKVRRALLDYIDIVRPPWIQNATYGRARVIAFANSGISQIFIEAGLAYGTDPKVVEFWDELALKARGQKNMRLNNIGRIGERLTLEYERARTKREPKWISIDSNADGYDILSIANQSDISRLPIEVKTSSIGLTGSFHLSSNEWECALSNDFHLFHLWDISGKKPRLAIISKDEVLGQVPINQGTGEWQSVEIPFSSFIKFFIESDSSLV